jgi:hypothetical protein
MGIPRRPRDFSLHSGRFLVLREVEAPADDTRVGVSLGFAKGCVEGIPPE